MVKREGAHLWPEVSPRSYCYSVSFSLRFRCSSQETGIGPMAEAIFAGKVALVTGASSGIGRASAIALGERGADVALNYFSLEESAQKAAARIRSLGRKALLFSVDIADQYVVEA